MGIVTRNAAEIFRQFADMVEPDAGETARVYAQPASPNDGAPPDLLGFTIECRYPASRAKRGDEMEFNLWRNFFSHYDFRYPKDWPDGVRDGYRVIERVFKPMEIRSELGVSSRR